MDVPFCHGSGARRRTGAVVVLWLLLGPAASAGERQDSEAPPPPGQPQATDALVTPFSIGAARPETALVYADGGFDGARKAGVVDFAAELHLWGPIYLRGGGSYVSADNTLKPTAGLLVRLFRAQGWNGAAGVFYKPEGLTEPEGEIEGLFAVSTRIDATTLTANLVYGQDAEASESDAEVRAGAVVRAGRRFLVGADSRFRLAIRRKAGSGEPDYDLVAGPLATLVLPQVAITAEAGVSMLKTDAVHSGPIVLLGVTRVF